MSNVLDLNAMRAPTEADPSFLAAEHAILGCALYDNAAVEMAEGLRPEHFREPVHGLLWGAILERVTAGRLADPITVEPALRGNEAFRELGGMQFLADLIDRAPATHNAHDYAAEIMDAAANRRLAAIGAEMARAAAAGGSSAPNIEAAEQALFDLAEEGSEEGRGPVAFSDSLARALKSAAEACDRHAPAGLSTGLTDLDRKIGGLHPTDLVIVAARPSMGKTAIAGQIAEHVARTHGPVLFFSLEMSDESLAMRQLAQASRVAADRVRKGIVTEADYRALAEASDRLTGLPLVIDATGGIAIAKLRARARRMKRKQGLALVLVDYLQLVTGSHTRRNSDSRVLEIGEITQSLKAMAKELDVPVIAFAQLSRQVENRDNKRPMLADLRESGSIEQDADLVMFLHREEYYLSRSEPAPDSNTHGDWLTKLDKVRGRAEIIIGKYRHGSIGTVRLHYNDELTLFSNAAFEGREFRRWNDD